MKVPTHTAGEDGFSKWIPPAMKGYRLICCDCGLSHEMEFRVVKVTRRKGEEWWWKNTKPGAYRVLFRAARHNRSTAAVRRERKKRESK